MSARPRGAFERPELSSCLAGLDRATAEYAEAVGIILAGAELLARQPRGDGGEMQACAVDQRREEKYVSRQAIERRNRAAIRSGGKAYDAP